MAAKVGRKWRALNPRKLLQGFWSLFQWPPSSTRARYFDDEDHGYSIVLRLNCPIGDYGTTRPDVRFRRLLRPRQQSPSPYQREHPLLAQALGSGGYQFSELVWSWTPRGVILSHPTPVS